MRIRKICFIPLLIMLCSAAAQKASKISANEFEILVGSWQGSLTYLDYSSGKPYTMSANIDIKRIGKTNEFIFSNIYPKEQNANSVDTLILAKDGAGINDETVSSKRKLSDGNTELVTEILGKDGNDQKPAMIRHTYIFGKELFIKTKYVQFVGQAEWIKRNEYSYKKKTSS